MVPLHTTCDIINHELNCVFVLSQVYTALVGLRYYVTDVYVKTMFHHEEDSVTVAVIASVATEDLMVKILKLSITKILSDSMDNSSNSQNIINTFSDLEVTGYLPSCMLLYINNVHAFVCVFFNLSLQTIVSVMLGLSQTL